MRAAVASILFASTLSAANWIHLTSDNVEIFTDSGAKTARAVLDRFETLRHLFPTSYIADPPFPVRVYLFASAADFEKYAMDPSADAFNIAHDIDDTIVLHQESALARVASHEFLHMVIHHASPLLPHWLDEGLADFYSTTSIDGAKVRVGDPIDSHLASLQNRPWLNAAELASANHLHDGNFYPQSWAMVHMLSLAPKWRGGMPELVKQLTAGRSQEDAFQSAFGKSMEQAIDALHAYVLNMRSVTIPAPPKALPASYGVTSVAPVDAAIALGELALRTDHAALARSLIAGAAKKNPGSAASLEASGELALAENRKDDARRDFDQAIALGSKNANGFFQLAMLDNDSELLKKTIAIDPNFSEALFILGVRSTDSGDLPSAVEFLRRAVALQPRRFTYWNALGYAQAKNGDRRAAAESARRAAVLASTEPEEQMAASLSLLASEVPPVEAKLPGVVTPSSWQNPKGDARAEGIMTEVDCTSSPVRILLATAAGGTLELHIEHPREVELVSAGGASTNLACGTQSRPVLIEYIAQTRAVTRLEFRSGVIMKP